MKRWALVVVLLYILIFAVMTLPVMTASFLPLKKDAGPFALDTAKIAENLKHQSTEVFRWWGFWVLLVTMVLGQAALLATPVAVAQKRPVSKRSLIFPVIAAGLAMGLLAAGAALSISEFFLKADEATGLSLMVIGTKDSDLTIPQLFASPLFLRALGVLLFAWLLWALIFYRWSRNTEPRGFVDRLCRYLYRGSVLELLIAVPTHVIARSRDYCCAGASTFFGIMFGLAVMLFSFGPGVFLLYAKRWERVRPRKERPVSY